ncbi:hypothetical protein SAMN02910292_00801 [Lachnospiraceae bacterium XBB2008]|nr:hypothetical protein SAMN02910292_00801 [Lachnospiraceae bacterium XBB2008]
MKILKTKTLAAITLIIYILSCIPVIYIGFFNYASGDDYLYGAPVKHAIENHANFLQVISVAWRDVIREYYSFQGTLATMFVWRFEPSIWGEKLYSITIFISVGILSIGIFFLFNVILTKLLKLEKSVYIIASSLALFMIIQFMVYPASGLYFFPGVIRYTFAFGLVCLACGFTILYLTDGFKRHLVAVILLMTYLGGSGFPPIVMSGLGVFFLMAWGFLSGDPARKRRSLFMLIPLGLEMVGFIIAATCPGNKFRGGEDFGFSIGRVFEVFYKSFKFGTVELFKYFLDVRPLCLLLIFVFVLAFVSRSKRASDEQGASAVQLRITVKNLLIVGILGWFIVCMTRSPEYYAGDTVWAGISGGVYDSYYYVSVVYIVVMSAMLGLFFGGFGKAKAADLDASGDGITAANKRFADIAPAALLVFLIVFVALLNRHLIGNMVDYDIYKFVSSGQAADYEAQMQERLAVFNDPNVTDAVVPYINDKQGPLMHMPITEDVEGYTNKVTADFYGKNTVQAIGREEWNEQYGAMWNELYGK